MYWSDYLVPRKSMLRLILFIIYMNLFFVFKWTLYFNSHINNIIITTNDSFINTWLVRFESQWEGKTECPWKTFSPLRQVTQITLNLSSIFFLVFKPFFLVWYFVMIMNILFVKWIHFELFLILVSGSSVLSHFHLLSALYYPSYNVETNPSP